MANRERPIQKKLWLTSQEEKLIEHKMKQLGTKNFGAYERKMLIAGYAIKVDYTEERIKERIQGCNPASCKGRALPAERLLLRSVSGIIK